MGQAPADSGGLPPGFANYVARALEQLHAPGAAVAIVKDGRVLLEQGYGFRDLEHRLPVDAHTRFQIASNTKAFTAAALAILATRGKLEWGDRVVEHLPSFALSDPYVTHEMTIADLLSHHSGLGLGAGDLLWLHSQLDRKEIVRRLRYIKLATSFRSHYAYDNVLYDAAGELIEAVSGEPWERFIAREIFQPLGMTDSRTSITDLAPGDDVARPYGRRDGRTVLLSYDTVTNLAPGGGIVSSVSDLSHWLQVQLDSGRTAGGRLWAQKETRAMWSPQTIIPVGQGTPELRHLVPNFNAYGLGWHLMDYRGHKIVTHSGGLAGMISQTFLIPDIGLGVVVLTNGESSAATAIAERVVDHYLGAPPFDYVGGAGQSERAGGLLGGGPNEARLDRARRERGAVASAGPIRRPVHRSVAGDCHHFARGWKAGAPLCLLARVHR